MLTTLAPTAIVGQNVVLGDESRIEDYVVLGSGAGEDAPRLVIGSGAHIRSHSVVYAGSRIGDRFQTGHGVMIREANAIGDDVSIGTHSIVEHHVEIADGVRIHSNAFIPEFTVIEAGAWIGPSVTLTNARYPTSRDAKRNLRGPLIRAGARVGANATVLPGIIIGRDALVGAGSVVVTDVPDGAVVVGNPARIVRHVTDIPDYRDE